VQLRSWRFLALVLFAAWPLTANANQPDLVYYDIVGNSAAELRQQMNAKGPVGQSGKRMDGYTHWHVAWSYRYAPASGGCKITELTVTVTATITLPRWAVSDRAGNALIRKWENYASALRLHEDGHYSHGIQAAEEIRSLRHTLHTPDGCSTFERQFDGEATSILEKYRRADAAYDADTKHGRTQGATFP
jgi:predicted secreted Zn-dependent protease